MQLDRRGRFSLLKFINFVLILLIVSRMGYIYAQKLFENVFNTGEVTVPDLIGIRLTDALKVVDMYDLKISVRGEEFNEIQKDCVARQEPQPGRNVKPGRSIDVIISKGVEALMSPDVTGMRFTQASLAIRNAGLLPGKKTYVHHNTIEVDHVIAQAPERGIMVNRTEPVDFLVSKGPRPEYVIMPDFLNGNFSVVRNILGDMGLELANPRFENDARKATGVILKQEPAPGSRVKKGSAVRFVVNRELGVKYSPEKRFKEVVFILPEGMMEREVRIMLFDDSGFREVYRRHHPPNDIIRLPVGGFGEMKVVISLDGQTYKEEML